MINFIKIFYKLFAFNFIFLSLSSTTVNIEVLDKGEQKVVLFHDTHTCGLTKEVSFKNDNDFKQAFYVAKNLKRFFKNVSSISMIEDAYLPGRFFETHGFSKEYRESSGYRLRVFSFLTNVHLMALDYNLPIINLEYRRATDFWLSNNFHREYLLKIVKQEIKDSELRDELIAQIQRFNINLVDNLIDLLIPCFSKGPTLRNLSNSILDQLAIQEIINHHDKKYIFIYMGSLHCINIRNYLMKNNFKLTFSFYDNDKYLVKRYSDIPKIKPVDIEKFFAYFVAKEGLAEKIDQRRSKL